MVGADERQRRRLRPGGHARRRRHRADRHLGHQPRGRAADRRQRARSRARAGSRRARSLCARRSTTWGSRRAGSSPTSRLIACSSAPAPMRASRTCARRRRCWPAEPARCPDWSPPARLWSSARRKQEGLDRIFRDAGLEWGESGCSMCVGINGDLVASGERCASTTNRNFRGRQGPGARTHLMSPAMVAAAAVTGHLADVRPLLGRPEGLSRARMDKFTQLTAPACPLDSDQSQHRSAVAGALSEMDALGGHRQGAVAGPALRCRGQRAAGFSAQQAGVAQRQDHRRRVAISAAARRAKPPSTRSMTTASAA